MNGDDVYEAAVKAARDIERLPLDLGHEECFGIRNRVKVLFNDIAEGNDPLDILIGNAACTHTLLRVLRDDVAVVSNGLA